MYWLHKTMVPQRYQGVGGNKIFKHLSENTLNNAGCETSRHFGNKLRGLFGIMTNQYTIISQIINAIICEIIVSLLVIVQNNKRCTVQILKFKKWGDIWKVKLMNSKHSNNRITRDWYIHMNEFKTG